MNVYGDNVSGVFGLSDLRGNEVAESVEIEGVPEATSFYNYPFETEFIPASMEGFDWNYSLDPDKEEAFNTQYMSSSKLKGTVTSPNDMLIVRAAEIELTGVATVTTPVTGGHRSFAGDYTGTPFNPMPSFPWMPRGGDGHGIGHGGYTSVSQPGGVGFSGGAYGYASNLPTKAAGGGFIMLICDSISGGTLRAKGGYAAKYDGRSYGGGGIILIFTKKWDATTAIDVTSSSPLENTDGSYAIIKIEDDHSLTLMVHSQNGVASDLNGQTPIHGADASVAW